LNLQVERGRPTIKSMLMFFHFQEGMFRGCSNLAGLI
jgi:hypothetical protein